VRLVKVVGAVNRGMGALSKSVGRRHFGYVVALTALVTLVGAAGMYAFERDVPGGPRDFWSALWWTAMVMTALGSEYWPRTGEGRVLCFLLALCSFSVFGYYVTATLATFFVGREAESAEGELAGAAAVAALRGEIALPRAEIRELRAPGSPGS
jgi:voltage-gated potassium channel